MKKLMYIVTIVLALFSCATEDRVSPTVGTATDRQASDEGNVAVFPQLGYGGNSVAFSPDGTQLVSGAGKTVILWDIATGREIRTLLGHSDYVSSVAFSPDGTQLVSGAGDWNTDGTVKLWDAATGREIRTFSGHSGPVNSVAFSPDGTQLVSGSGSLFRGMMIR
ncbi:WD40 repeat domain-containing protein [Breznakiellaceae bacterium SP9]